MMLPSWRVSAERGDVAYLIHVIDDLTRRAFPRAGPRCVVEGACIPAVKAEKTLRLSSHAAARERERGEEESRRSNVPLLDNEL